MTVQMKTDDVYQKIKDLIVYAHLKPGDTLTVGELAEQFGVSKTPVRDALNALKHQGFIDVLPYKGYMVTRIDVKKLLDLFQMRMILEGSAAELATRSVSDRLHSETSSLEHLMTLACVDVTDESHEPSVIQFQRANFNFHTEIARLSGNQYLYDTVANVLNQLQRVLYRDLMNGNPQEMRDEHIELVEVMKQGDPTRAKQVVIHQIETTQQRVLGQLA